jgi:hypothetical protein
MLIRLSPERVALIRLHILPLCRRYGILLP